jgi:hypothetical protein
LFIRLSDAPLGQAREASKAGVAEPRDFKHENRVKRDGLSSRRAGVGRQRQLPRDVVLTELVKGRSVLLATIPLDEWIGLGATQYVLELQAEGEEVLKPSDTSK